jgi:hypothetical protein
MHIALSVLAIAAFEAVSACAANSVSLDGEWKLDYWPQPYDGAVRAVASVPADAKSVKATEREVREIVL